jgi:hypothetical protein
MMHRIGRPRSYRFALAASLIALCACQSSSSDTTKSSHWPTPEQGTAEPAQKEQPRAQITNEFTATASVVAIAREERVVTLRREDGTLIDVKVGESARNFDQVKVGDDLKVRYKESIVATKLPPGEKTRPAEGALASGRAKAGAKPGAGVGALVTARVRIESVDNEHAIVVYSLSSGELVAHRLQTTEGKKFVEGLAVGDVVQIDCSQALALTVETP